jgi:transmembrane sensor
VDHKLHLLQLYPKLLTGEISTEELNKLTAYFDNGDPLQLIALIRAELDLSDALVEPVLNESEALSIVYKNLEQCLDLNVAKKDVSRSFITKLWFKISTAAAIAFILLGAGLLYFTNTKGIRVQDIVAANDIAPAKQGATLTLANGKQIKLSDVSNEELAKETGLKVSKAKNGQLVYTVSSVTPWAKDGYHILSTKKGEQYSVVLPDGSQVWLNAESSIKYPTSFTKAEKRRVVLTGEGYFEIAKVILSSPSGSSPSSGGAPVKQAFVVETKGQQVEVLGTHFNINAYADEPITATTLLEGSVKVTVGSANQLLKPGQQAASNGRSIKVNTANIEKTIDWKNGEFYINQINFRIAMRKIARWYDVEIIYNSSVPEDMQIGGWVSREEKLSSVLKSIELTGIAHFRVDGRKIYVSK